MPFFATFRIAGAVGALCAALAAPAHAGIIGPGDAHSDPVFTGSDVTFAASAGTSFRILTYTPGAGRRWTLSLPKLGPDRGAGAEIRLAGAGENRALVHSSGLTDEFSATRQDSLVLSPARGRAAALAGCATHVGVDPDGFAGDAGRAVYAPLSCGAEPAQRVVVRRHDSGAETELPVDPRHRVSHVRVAGSYIAFTDYAPAENSTTLRVFDGAGAETTVVTETGTGLADFALQDDGVVALCRDALIVEYPLGGGTRTLTDSECEGPLVAGDAGYLSVLSAGANQSVLAAYSGGRSRVLARLHGRAADQGRAAMYGRLVAFRRRACGGWEVVTTHVGDSSERAESRCRGQLGRPQRVRGGTELRVPVHCPIGCSGTVRIGSRRAAVELSRRGRRTVRLPLRGGDRRRRVAVTLALRQPPSFGRTRVADRVVSARP